jgi:hypothetical protein
MQSLYWPDRRILLVKFRMSFKILIFVYINHVYLNRKYVLNTMKRIEDLNAVRD